MRRRPVTGEGRILELSQCYLSSGERWRRLEEVAASRVSPRNIASKGCDTQSFSPEGNQARAGKGEIQLLANHAHAQCLCLDIK